MRAWPPLGLLLLVAFLDVAVARSTASAEQRAAEVSSVGSRILYTSDVAFPANEIYAADPSGRSAVGRLTFGKAPPCRRWPCNWCGWDAAEPSPDGSRVLAWFRHHSPHVNTRDTATLYVMQADGRGRVAVVRNVPLSRFDDPVAGWSPDSQSLAYWSGRDWHVFRADGKLVGSEFRAPEWAPESGYSPDGRWGVTTRDKAFTLVDIRRRRERTYSIQASSFTWSADSRRLALAGVEGGIYVLDTRSLRLRRLAEEGGRNLDWSPDGRSIAYVSRSRTLTDNGDLHVVTLAGRVTTVVDAAGDSGGVISHLAWTRKPSGVTYRRPPARFAVTGETATLPWDIDRVVTDGSRAAVIACGHVFAWLTVQKQVVQAENVASLSQLCDGPGFYSPTRMYDVAIAGDRVAWGYHQGNTGQQAELWVTSLVDRRALALLGRSSSTSGGPWKGLGELTGGGALLAYSTWSERCTGWCGNSGVTTEQSVRRIDQGGCPCPVLRSEPGPLLPLDADGGRVVAGGDNALLVLDSRGAELLSVAGRAAAASLSGRDLVVAARGMLRHHDARTGALLHSWPLPDVPTGQRCATPNFSRCSHPALVLEDSSHGLVTYVLEQQVHVLRLADGRDVVVSRGQSSGFVDAGLVVAVGPRLRLIRFGELAFP